VHVLSYVYWKNGVPFVKILYLTDLAQKVPSLRIYGYLYTDLIISGRDSYLRMQRCYLWKTQLSLHAEIALKRVEGKHGILSEEKLGVLFQ